MNKLAVYRIRVQGRLNASLSNRLGSMEIKVDPSGKDGPVTTLKGALIDQAALSSILETLYELHLSVIEVKHL